MQRRAFTLIELLVVISIIALLSSVVLASLNAARERGRMGAAKHFAAQVEHIAGDRAVGIWDFDECTGSVLADRSGNGINGSFFNGNATFSPTNTPNGTGCSLAAANSYVVLPDNVPAFSFGTGNVTVSGWIYPNAGGGNSTGIFGEGGLWLEYNITTKKMRVSLRDTAANIFNQEVDPPILDNKWTHVALVVNRSTNFADVYIDGVVRLHANISVLTTNLSEGIARIGSTEAGNRLVGNIDGVRVFSKELSASEVGRLYAEGLTAHSVAQK